MPAVGGTKRVRPQDKLFYMQHKDVIPGEHCGCESSTRTMLTARGH